VAGGGIAKLGSRGRIEFWYGFGDYAAAIDAAETASRAFNFGEPVSELEKLRRRD